MSGYGEITPQELSEIKEQVQLVDVRDSFEVEIASLGGINIPLAQLEERVGELDPTKETVVYCHHGIRSRHGAMILQAHGFSQVKNLAGGIDRWSFEIDSSLPRY